MEKPQARRLVAIGSACLLTLVLAIGGYFVFRPSQQIADNSTGAPTTATESITTVSCIGGSEKSELMADPEIQRILRDKHQLAVKFSPAGSYDQVRLTAEQLNQQGVNCLWPSSASALSVFEKLHPSPSSTFAGYQTATVLQSPEVIYAGPEGTAALIEAGIVQQKGEQYYIIDLKSLLLDYVLEGKTWNGDLKTPTISGPIKIASTDPAKSNSGFTLAQLELTILTTDDVYSAPSLAQAQKGLATVRQLYDAQGLQVSSSGAAFEQYLLQGGELHSPLFAGYENQIIQQLVKYQPTTGTANGTNPAAEALKSNVIMLYPDPTIYSDHPIIALNADAGRLIEAMKDPDIQKIAWQTYGFRSGTTVGLNNVADFPDLHLAQQLRTTTPPNADVTMLLLACLQENKC